MGIFGNSLRLLIGIRKTEQFIDGSSLSYHDIDDKDDWGTFVLMSN